MYLSEDDKLRLQSSILLKENCEEMKKYFDSLKLEVSNDKIYICVIMGRSIVVNIESMLELYLIYKNEATGIILRNVLETYINLRNVIKNEMYIEIMLRDTLIADKNFFESVIKYPKFTTLKGEWNKAEEADLGNVIKKIDEEKKYIEEKCGNKFYNKFKSIKSRFKEVEEEESKGDYSVFYNRLCVESHGNLNALIKNNDLRERLTNEYKKSYFSNMRLTNRILNNTFVLLATILDDFIVTEKFQLNYNMVSSSTKIELDRLK